MNNERERGTGRYKFTVDRMCVCGHPLGDHTAERAKGSDGRVYQECIVHDMQPGAEPCGCELFKPARAPRRPAIR